jgi:hypothetical protein
MEWDLGLKGLLYLGAMSIGFGLLAQLLSGRTAPRWLWALVSVIYFGVGIFVSEVWFGDATEQDLQPIIDGLSRDEVLAVGLIPVAAAVLVTRVRARRCRHAADVEDSSATTRGEPTPHAM